MNIGIFATWNPPTIIVPGASTTYVATVDVSTALGPATNPILINLILNCPLTGGCGTQHNINGTIAHISDAARTISLSGQATATELFFPPASSLPIVIDLQDYLSIFVTLPDALSIAAPVPEPSTWAMLLIGFAGLGFAVIGREVVAPGRLRIITRSKGAAAMPAAKL